jgi:predicted GNAT family acetyltransferase
MDIKFNEIDNEAQVFDGDDKVGYCQFEVEDDKTWNVTHTVVNPAYGGKGLAGKLLDTVVDKARENGVKIIPTCSYARKKFDTDEKYSDVYAK